MVRGSNPRLVGCCVETEHHDTLSVPSGSPDGSQRHTAFHLALCPL